MWAKPASRVRIPPAPPISKLASNDGPSRPVLLFGPLTVPARSGLPSTPRQCGWSRRTRDCRPRDDRDLGRQHFVVASSQVPSSGGRAQPAFHSYRSRFSCRRYVVSANNSTAASKTTLNAMERARMNAALLRNQQRYDAIAAIARFRQRPQTAVRAAPLRFRASSLARRIRGDRYARRPVRRRWSCGR